MIVPVSYSRSFEFQTDGHGDKHNYKQKYRELKEESDRMKQSYRELELRDKGRTEV